MSTPRLNILLLPRWYPNATDPQLGVFIQKHARAMALNNNVVVFYAQPGKLSYQEETTVDGLREFGHYYRVNTGIFGPVINAWRYFRCWQKFKKDVSLYSTNGFRPDLFHPYIFLRTVLLVWYEQLFHDIPYVYSEQWSGFLSGKISAYPSIKIRLIRRIFRRARAISAVSSVLADRIRSFSSCRDIQIIRNTVQVADLTSRKTDHEKTRILVVADLLDEIKNISDVIRAISDVAATNDSIELRIVGGGPDEYQLKELAASLGVLDRIVFFDGKLDNQGVYRQLLRSDFLVMNSRHETFSLICAEALSCGIPVIATRCGGPEEIVTEECGILIPTDNLHALTDAIRTMISSHRQYSAKKLADYAAARFSISGAAEEFSALYKKAISS